MPATLIYSSVANYISLYQLFSLDLPTFYSPTAAPPPKKKKKYTVPHHITQLPCFQNKVFSLYGSAVSTQTEAVLCEVCKKC